MYFIHGVSEKKRGRLTCICKSALAEKSVNAFLRNESRPPFSSIIFIETIKNIDYSVAELLSINPVKRRLQRYILKVNISGGGGGGSANRKKGSCERTKDLHISCRRIVIGRNEAVDYEDEAKK